MKKLFFLFSIIIFSSCEQNTTMFNYKYLGFKMKVSKVTDISSEIDRLRKLRQNFPETMKRLRDFKCIDVSDEEIINHSMDKFVKQLKRPKVI